MLNFNTLNIFFDTSIFGAATFRLQCPLGLSNNKNEIDKMYIRIFLVKMMINFKF